MNLYLQIFTSFAKIGAFTIGGGYAMIPLIQEEVVNKKKNHIFATRFGKEITSGRMIKQVL